MCKVFIGCCNQSGERISEQIYDYLDSNGMSVCYEKNYLRIGVVREAIFDRIEECDCYVAVLTPGALDGCSNPDDLMSDQIAAAIAFKKRIVTVIIPGFEFPNYLPDEIRGITECRGVVINNNGYIEGQLAQVYAMVKVKKSLMKKTVVLAVASFVVLLSVVFSAAAFSGEQSDTDMEQDTEMSETNKDEDDEDNEDDEDKEDDEDSEEDDDKVEVIDEDDKDKKIVLEEEETKAPEKKKSEATKAPEKKKSEATKAPEKKKPEATKAPEKKAPQKTEVPTKSETSDDEKKIIPMKEEDRKSFEKYKNSLGKKKKDLYEQFFLDTGYEEWVTLYWSESNLHENFGFDEEGDNAICKAINADAGNIFPSVYDKSDNGFISLDVLKKELGEGVISCEVPEKYSDEVSSPYYLYLERDGYVFRIFYDESKVVDLINNRCIVSYV